MNHQENFLALVEELRPYVTEVNVDEVNNNLKNQEDFVLIDVLRLKFYHFLFSLLNL